MTASPEEIHVTDPGAAAAVLAALNHGAVILQMPTVFVLLAPPNRQGARWLDETKIRKPNKNYGCALGHLEPFRAMARPGSLPAELEAPGAFDILTGAFIRITVADEQAHTPVIRNGTHQALLLEGPHRELFQALESGLLGAAEPSMFGGHTYSAPLCTSANYSGHVEGSITELDKARQFAKERRLRLFVRAEPDPSSAGSYPIFWLRRHQISVEREGPGLEALRAALPPHLFSEETAS